MYPALFVYGGAQPKLSVANLDGSITALCLAYDDMLKGKSRIHDNLCTLSGCGEFSWMGNLARYPTKSWKGNFCPLILVVMHLERVC